MVPRSLAIGPSIEIGNTNGSETLWNRMPVIKLGAVRIEIYSRCLDLRRPFQVFKCRILK